MTYLERRRKGPGKQKGASQPMEGERIKMNGVGPQGTRQTAGASCMLWNIGGILLNALLSVKSIRVKYT